MKFDIFDQNGQKRILNKFEYLNNLLIKTEIELRNHFLIRKQSQSENRLNKKELKFQNWTNRYKLRFLIYDFLELKECKDTFFERNHYIINQQIKLLTKALNCKHRHCEHPQV